ncbi:MAG: zinc ribbon domain-containing protein [Atopobiaceae bacterium]|nr:zinc ribbon domain-containing protein [Atopobiaceae bacterium]
MSWFINPSRHLRAGELPPELVITNNDYSVTQVYVPERTAKKVRVPRKDHLRIGHLECSECGTPIGYNNRFCHHCGARLLEDES